MTPNDFAYAWLFLGRAIPTWPDNGGPDFADGLHEIHGDRIQRAAVCAELGIIACQQWPMHAAPTPEDLTDRNFVRALAYGMKIDPMQAPSRGAGGVVFLRRATGWHGDA